ncbi:hypothetical protein FLA_4046 [Filimonas lacunae]|nr:hypothetical protein FLA_4046 [Filimonas lacunae]
MLSVAVAATIVVVACKKDETKATTGGSATYQNKTYMMDSGYTYSSNDYSYVYLANQNIVNVLGYRDTTKLLNVVYLVFPKASIPAGTFTYDSNLETLDSTKNFSGGEVALNYNIQTGAGVGLGIVSGTVTVSKENTNYGFNYKLKLSDSTTITGGFNGSLGIVEP